MIVARVIMVVLFNVLLNIIVLKIVSIVISEFVRFFLANARLLSGGRSYWRR